MVNETEIRGQLARYLVGEIPLDQFEEWLVQGSWDAHLDSEGSAQELAYNVELKLAEFSSGHLSEEELRRGLRPLLEYCTVRLGVGQQPVITTSTGTSSAFTFRGGELGQPVGIGFSVVSV